MTKVHPLVVEPLRLALKECLETVGSKVLITQSLRTIAEQNALYSQGRTIKGKIVTNAKGGQSVHNYGLAVDFCLVKDGKAFWDEKHKDWLKVVAIFKKNGFTWGGDWKTFKDYPHFEWGNKYYPNGWRDLQKMKIVDDWVFIQNSNK